MKLKKFNVVELKNNNRATILEVKGNNQYFVEIVNASGVTLENKIIMKNDINKVIYSRGKER